MENMNVVILEGNVTSEPELKYTPSGTAVANVTIAINGRKEGDVSFFTLNIWGKAAEHCSKYMAKGTHIVTRGRLKQDRWKTRDGGENRSTVKIDVEFIRFVGGKRKEIASDGPVPGEQDPFNHEAGVPQ